LVTTPVTADVALDASTLAVLRAGGEYSSCECLADRQTANAHCNAVRPAVCEAEMVSVGNRPIEPLSAHALMLLGYDATIEGDRPRTVWQDEMAIGLALRCDWADAAGSAAGAAELRDSFGAILSVGESEGADDAYSADGVAYALGATIGSELRVQARRLPAGPTGSPQWLDGWMNPA
jgi:hypothetical protein